MNHHFLEDETLTDNLDDSQAGRLLHILEQAVHIDPDNVDQIILLVKILNQAIQHNQELQLVEEIISKLEAKYV